MEKTGRNGPSLHGGTKRKIPAAVAAEILPGGKIA